MDTYGQGLIISLPNRIYAREVTKPDSINGWQGHHRRKAGLGNHLWVLRRVAGSASWVVVSCRLLLVDGPDGISPGNEVLDQSVEILV